ncbi:serine hydrolase domain-containing protein [Pediococcus pentosaceus]|uniref:serine hydrolase domain-containing protein n=1 Tax=Pediococcus pentosaceus TaxID=1255 RepID=UPI002D80C48E|nr:serine hydrolase domain-containing protein [Pediococcus pentosaceus]
MKNNKIVDSYVSGSATDVDKNMLTTTYEIDSLQKVLTAGLVMNQVNKGKLKLTDRVNKFIPDLPGSKYITIRELLDMNSGLSMKKMKFSGNNLSSAELLDVVIDNVRFDANTKKSGKWSYQPVNFVILSEILEEITGKSYKQLFDETYVKKLKLKQTEFAYDDNIETNRAYGYVVKENGDRIEQKPNGATIFSELGTGQVYMSAPDYYKLVASLLNGKILGTDAAKELYLPLGNGKYRAGLYTSKKPFYRYANGYGYGFESHVRISQDGKKAVVVFSNHQVSGNNGLKKKVDQLSKKFLGYK